MSHRPLLVGDSVKVYIDDINQCPNNARIGFGFIRFIGFIPSLLESGKYTQSIGIELIEKIYDGHDGRINNTQYFNVEKGYGIIIPITNIIKIVSTIDLMLELRKTMQILQEKNEYIQRLEGIISSKKNYLPRRTPTMLTKINVNLQPNPPPKSQRSTFILPEPITPITPNTPNIPHTPNTPNSVIYSANTPSVPSRTEFPRISVQKRPSVIFEPFEGGLHHLQKPSCSRISMVSSRHSSVSQSFPSISFGTSSNSSTMIEEEPSITDNSKEYINNSSSSLSISTPITPFTPTSPNVSFVIHEVGANHLNDIHDVNVTSKRYNTDRLHPNHQYSTSTSSATSSLTRRVSLLYKKPIPEVRNKNSDKKRRKSAKMRNQNSSLYYD